MVFGVDIHLDDPDVVVRVHPEKGHMPPFAVLQVGHLHFFPNHIIHDLDHQLGMIEHLGEQIASAARAARPDIPRVA